MPTQAPSRFMAYEFTQEELRSASTFSLLQKQYLQTQICNIAEQMINLDCADVAERSNFEIQRSFLKGQMVMLQFLLNTSDMQEEEIKEAASGAASNSNMPELPGANLYAHFIKPSTNGNQE